MTLTTLYCEVVDEHNRNNQQGKKQKQKKLGVLKILEKGHTELPNQEKENW